MTLFRNRREKIIFSVTLGLCILSAIFFYVGFSCGEYWTDAIPACRIMAYLGPAFYIALLGFPPLYASLYVDHWLSLVANGWWQDFLMILLAFIFSLVYAYLIVFIYRVCKNLAEYEKRLGQENDAADHQK